MKLQERECLVNLLYSLSRELREYGGQCDIDFYGDVDEAIRILICFLDWEVRKNERWIYSL